MQKDKKKMEMARVQTFPRRGHNSQRLTAGKSTQVDYIWLDEAADSKGWCGGGHW